MTYQNKVNGLVGAMGPSSTAVWNNSGSTSGYPWLLSAQPMYYSPVTGKYITSYDSSAGQGSVSFSYGKRKTKRKSKKTRKTKLKSKKTRKTKLKSLR
jgi:hypothetical protein